MSTAVPSRSMLAVRPSSSPGILASSAAVAAVFAGTPFILAEAIDEFGVGSGTAALLSTMQVGAFMVVNLAAGRRMHPSALLMRLSLVALTVLNLLAALAPSFELLALTRLLAGLPMGLITWISWSTSAADGRRRGEVASMGPVAAALVMPIIGLASSAGLTGMYFLVAALSGLCLLVPVEVTADRPKGARNPIGAPIVKFALLSLFLLSAAGSSVFIFVRVLAASELGLTALTTSIALSLNALAGIPTARFAGRRRLPGLWLLVIAGCALALTNVTSTAVFFAIVIIWGFAFWSFVPEAFALMADHSVYPSDRVGDAQAVMSFGRVLGPTFGGVLLATGGFGLLGWVATGLIIVAAVAIEIVSTEHRWRR